MSFIELILNVTVAALLMITLSYCWRLNARIRALQDGRGELARLLKHFDESTRRAADSIAALQLATRKLSEIIQGRIDKANLVADDLMFLVERAVKLSDDMEAALAARRAADAALTSSLRAAAPPPPAAPKLAARPEVKKPAAPATTDAKALLEALARRGASDPALRGARPSAQKSAARAEPERTRVEQELLELIKAGS